MTNPNADPQKPQEWTLRDYINIVIRRRYIIIGVFAVVFCGIAIYTFSRPPMYMSSASFIIENPEQGLNNMLNRWDPFAQDGQARPLEFYRALLKSHAFLEMVMREAKLDTFWINSGLSEEEIYVAFAQNLSLIPSSTTELYYLSAMANDPLIVYHMADIALGAFKTRCQEIELEETRNVIDYVEKQKQVSRDKLEDAERQLQKFNESSGMAYQGEGGLLQMLVELKHNLSQVQAERELAEANIAAYDRRLKDLKAPNTPDINEMESPEAKLYRQELDRLMERRSAMAGSGIIGVPVQELDQRIEEARTKLYTIMISQGTATETVPVMDNSLWEELRASRIREELNLYMLKNRERYFQRLLAEYQQKNPQIVEKSVEMSRLQRSKEVYENLFNILLEKGEEARIKSATSTAGIRIIDFPTIPRQPIPINTRRKLLTGLMLGLGLGFGLALVSEYLDNSIRSKEDVERYFKLSLMGSIPTIAGGKNGYMQQKLAIIRKKKGSMPQLSSNENGFHDHLLTSLKPRDPIVDTYRTLRSNIQFASLDKPLRSLLITSSLPGEGKSLNSANISISFAELGKKVCIVDGDLRKPRQHQIFSVHKSPGLTDCLVRDLTLEKVVFPTHVPNLYIIPCGTIPPNPAEMIASQKMTDFIAGLEKKFDLVIFDSPPLTVVTDPVLFATKVSYVALIIKFADTNRRIVNEALTSLERSRTPILGAILNGVKLGAGYGYYRSYYSYYYADSGKKRTQKV
ncbi:polysaccharide biosynthesis tyrosine autokinase [candidate division KSB1 bacterium]|nr:polysaccharide biosynthesis tyrosine autokinase [candidate division KSB1 bacterium]